MKIPQPQNLGSVNDVSVYLQSLVKATEIELGKRISTEAPVSSVLLASPDGSVYTVTVDNAGTLTATKVHQG